MIAPKKDRIPQFCIDYGSLNEITIPDAYQIPRMDDCIESLGASMIYTALDPSWGYWQLPIVEKYPDKTTFVSHGGTFRCKRMPFGLRNAPPIFQSTLYLILYGVCSKTCVVYLDDVPKCSFFR